MHHGEGGAKRQGQDEPGDDRGPRPRRGYRRRNEQVRPDQSRRLRET